MRDSKYFEVKYPEVHASNSKRAITVNPLEEFEHYFFDNKCEGNYRNQAIDKCIENKENFSGTCNSTFELLKRFVAIKCPVCGELMIPKNGGGGGLLYNMNFSCTCGARSNLHVTNEALSFYLSESNSDVILINKKIGMTFSEFKKFVKSKFTNLIQTEDGIWEEICDTQKLMSIVPAEVWGNGMTEEAVLLWIYQNNMFGKLNKLF